MWSKTYEIHTPLKLKFPLYSRIIRWCGLHMPSHWMNFILWLTDHTIHCWLYWKLEMESLQSTIRIVYHPSIDINSAPTLMLMLYYICPCQGQGTQLLKKGSGIAFFLCVFGMRSLIVCFSRDPGLTGIPAAVLGSGGIWLKSLIHYRDPKRIRLSC